MSRKEKLIERLKRRPHDFTWHELVSLLGHFGYQQIKTGKTAGSRQRFVHPAYPIIILHKPHPSEILKRYQVDQVLEILHKEGLL